MLMKNFRKNLAFGRAAAYIMPPADAALGLVDAVPDALLGIAARKHFTVPE